MRYGKDRHGSGWKYGAECVIFRANGIEIYHSGDQEPQVIFEGKSATDIIPITSYEDIWQVGERGDTGEALFKDEDLDKVIWWIINNFAQYSKALFK